MQNHVEKCNELNILSLFSPISCSGSPFRRSLLDVFLGKVVQKICSNFKGESSCRSAVLIKLQSNFIEITFRHGCSPVNLLHIFKTPFPKNTSERMFLSVQCVDCNIKYLELIGQVVEYNYQLAVIF